MLDLTLGWHILWLGQLLFLTLAAAGDESDILVWGAGASLPGALYRNLAFAYEFASTVSVTYVSTGSGAGIRYIKGKDTLVVDGREEPIDFAGSDAVLTEQDYADVTDLQMYPSTATAVVPIYRLDNIRNTTLVLSREALAQIFLGNITKWNDPLIQATNPSSALPALNITVVVRQDSSGTTEIFTKALSLFSSEFKVTIGVSSSPEKWPSTFQTALGTDGVLAAVLAQDASIGFSVLSEVMDRDANFAMLINKAGKPVVANSASVQSALAELAGLILDNPRHTADIQDASSSSAWPISGLTYFILRTNHQAHDCPTRTATLDFIEWYYTSTTSERVQDKLGFAQLPESIREGMMERMFQTVKCNDGSLAKKNRREVRPVEIPVPALVMPIFDIFSAAYAEVDPNVAIIPVPYNRDDVNEIIQSSRYAATVFESSSNDTNSQADEPYVSPLFVTGVAIVYHLDGFDERLTLSPQTLARMFLGEITTWDDPSIALDNEALLGVSETIPNTPIHVVLRSDQSDTTWVFTSVIQDQTDYIDAPSSSYNIPIQGQHTVAASDSQVKAAVLYNDGAIGFVASFTSDDDSALKLADTISADGATVSLSAASLGACFSDPKAIVSVSDRVTKVDVEAVKQNPSCWPFMLSFELAIDFGDVNRQCDDNDDARSPSLEFVTWLFNPETSIDEPLSLLGAVPVSRGIRTDHFDKIFDGCTASTDSSIVTIVSTVLGILLATTLAVVLYQYHKVSKQRKLIDELKKHSFAMRSVIKDWVPGPVATSLSLSSSRSPAIWYWKEDEIRMDQHDISTRKNPHWIRYSADSSALIEAQYLIYQTNPRSASPKVQIAAGLYVIDVQQMTQTNTTTKFQRSILRDPAQHPKTLGSNPSTTIVSTPSNSEHRIPETIPRDEPFLELRTGSIVQTMKSSPCEKWTYGTVIVEPDGAIENHNLSGERAKISLESGTVVNVSKETGWFPDDLTAEPDRVALARLVEQIGGADASLTTIPSHWSPVADPLVAERFQLPKNSDEFKKIETLFRSTLDQALFKTVRIHSIERIQNVAMHQSFAVKRQTLLKREVDSKHKTSRYERRLFHGTNEQTIPKIIQQGFNRSFCGKNATMYGKGVYFANDATYSASHTYSVPNRKGHQFMFVVSVIVGEYCKGRTDALTPDVRDPVTHQLYDSTVDNVRNPRVFVTYHDSQAYPEYLICFDQNGEKVGI